MGTDSTYAEATRNEEGGQQVLPLERDEVVMTEADVLRALHGRAKLTAWLFGGAYGFYLPNTPRAPFALVVLPSLWRRLYFKTVWRWFLTKKG